MKKVQFIRFAKSAILMASATLFLFCSCEKYDAFLERQMKIDDEKLKTYINAQSVPFQKHSSGFYYSTVNSNPTGTQLRSGDIVKFRYSISLLNGTLIESTITGNTQPSYFKLGTYSIIPQALDYGINIMKTGEKYRFIVPSYLAFGSYASDDFPTNSNFIIDIVAIGAMTETQMDDIQRDSLATFMAANYPTYQNYASGLYFVDSIPGTGDKPFYGQQVTIDFKRKYLNNVLIKSSNDVTFFLNSNRAVEGLEEGLRLMKQNGTALLFMPSSIAFGHSVCVIPEKSYYYGLIGSDARPYSIVKYVVKLKAVN